MAREASCSRQQHECKARLAQLVERKALNLVVVGSSPTVGAFLASDVHNMYVISRCPGLVV